MTTSTSSLAALTTAGDENERAAAVHALEGSFSELMTAFRRHIAATAERVHPGLLPATFKVLSTVSRFGPITPSALAERLTADKAVVSRSVSELEELGLVIRTPDPADGRSRLVTVTARGEEGLAAARAPHEGRLFTVLEDWSVADIRHVTALVHALATGESPASS